MMLHSPHYRYELGHWIVDDPQRAHDSLGHTWQLARDLEHCLEIYLWHDDH